jgi:hypothetical protein
MARPLRTDSDFEALAKVWNSDNEEAALLVSLSCVLNVMVTTLVLLWTGPALPRLLWFLAINLAVTWPIWCAYSRSLRTVWSALVLTPFPGIPLALIGAALWKFYDLALGSGGETAGGDRRRDS